jgi:peptidoglycan hydrolase CwlO-like protein
MGNSDLENSLKNLDQLTQEEARMAQAEQLKVSHSIDEKVTDVDKGVKRIDETAKGIEGEVQDARSDVQDVGSKVESVEESMQALQDDVKDAGNMMRIAGSDIKDISSEVRDVDDKLDQVKRSYYLNPSSLFRELRWIYREPAQRKSFPMAIGPRSIHQP